MTTKPTAAELRAAWDDDVLRLCLPHGDRGERYDACLRCALRAALDLLAEAEKRAERAEREIMHQRELMPCFSDGVPIMQHDWDKAQAELDLHRGAQEAKK